MTKRIPAPDVTEHAADGPADERGRSMTPSGVHARKPRASDADHEAAPRGALAGGQLQPKESARSGTHRVDPNRKRAGDPTVQAAAMSAFSPHSAANATANANANANAGEAVAADGGGDAASAGIETVRVSLTPAHFEAMLGTAAADGGGETLRVSLTPAHARAMLEATVRGTPASGSSGAAPGGETVRVQLTPSRVENLLRGSAADGGEAVRPRSSRPSGRVPTLPGAGPGVVSAERARATIPPSSPRIERPSITPATPARAAAARSGHTAAGIGPVSPTAARPSHVAPRSAQPQSSRTRVTPPPPLTGSFGTHPGIDFSSSASLARGSAPVSAAVGGIASRWNRRTLSRWLRLAHVRIRSWLKLQPLATARPRSPEDVREYKARMRAALAAHVRANAARAAALARVNASNPSLPREPQRAQAIAPPPTPAAQAYAAAVGGEIRASMRAAGSPGDDPHWLAALAPLVAADRAAALIRAAHGDAGSPPASAEPAADGGDTLEPSELGGRDDGTSGGRGGWGERHLSLLQAALIALLAAGAADLLVLNLWAVPKALQETSISAARKTQARVPTPAVRSTMPAPRPAVAPTPVVVAAPPPAPAAPERLGFVLFRYGDFWVGPKSHATLLEMVPRMAADTRAVHLIGHADAHGTPSVNTRISEARAHAVARVLIDNGVPEDRIRISGIGSDGLDESALSRRVELQLEDMP